MIGWRLFLVVAVSGAGACTAILGDDFTIGDDEGGATSADGGGGAGAGTVVNVGGAGGSGGAGGPPPTCDELHAREPQIDHDGDGWSFADGDCNDCTDLINPGALDYPGNDIDEDCSGTADDDPIECDGALDPMSNDPVDAARALGLCKPQQGESYGTVAAQYVLVDGSPAPGVVSFDRGHGILSGFGAAVQPREGTKLLAISSGTARSPADPGFQSPQGYNKNYSSMPAPGFPKPVPGCGGLTPAASALDAIALRVTLRVPTNAQSLAFAINSYHFDFPAMVCSGYNDHVTVMMSPPPPGLPGVAVCGGVNCGNITFDAEGNTLGVNSSLFEVCMPQTVAGKNFPCPLGPAALQGTGFDGRGATGWLETHAPVVAGEDIVIEFGVWDTGDAVSDSTVLIDAFRFEAATAMTETVRIPQ